MQYRFSKITPSLFFDKASCTRQFESELSLHSLASLFPIKEGSTSHPCPLSSGAREETALLGARNRYAIRLTGHQSPRQIVRDGTAGGQLAITCWLRPPFLFLIAVSLCTCRHSNEEYYFYSTLERITSGEVPIRVMAE